MRRLLTLAAAFAAVAATQHPLAATAADGDTVTLSVPPVVVATNGCLSVPYTVTHTLATTYNTKARVSVAMRESATGKIVGVDNTEFTYATSPGTTTGGLGTCFGWSPGTAYTVDVTLTRSSYESCARGYDNTLYCTGLKSFGSATAAATTSAVQSVDVDSSVRTKLKRANPNRATRTLTARFTAAPTPAGPYVEGSAARWVVRVNGKRYTKLELTAGATETLKVKFRPRTSRPTWIDFNLNGSLDKRVKVKPPRKSR